jgi:hypothetical protein
VQVYFQGKRGGRLATRVTSPADARIG